MSRIPGTPNTVVEVRFEDYEWIEGVAIATVRKHIMWPEETEPPDPLNLEPRPATLQPETLLVERLEHVRLLSSEELETLVDRWESSLAR
jgi:hypothetical protein